MKTQKKIWFDGKMVRWGDARIHVLSHALHYGSGVFEGIRAYETAHGSAIFRLRDHVDRLFRSAAALGMKIPYSKQAVSRAIVRTVAENRLRSCYIRPIVFYGEGQMGLTPHGAKLHIAIAAWPWGAYLGSERALSVGVSSYIRFHPRSIAPDVKITGYYATSILATIAARADGFDECILLGHEGMVAEGPGENIFMVKRGRLLTPKSPSILRGITRDSVMAIARGMHITASEKRISLRQLLGADEVFLVGTAAEVAPVGKIGGRRIGKGIAGPLTRKVRTAYLEAVHGELPRYRKWLTTVRTV